MKAEKRECLLQIDCIHKKKRDDNYRLSLFSCSYVTFYSG